MFDHFVLLDRFACSKCCNCFRDGTVINSFEQASAIEHFEQNEVIEHLLYLFSSPQANKNPEPVGSGFSLSLSLKKGGLRRDRGGGRAAGGDGEGC